MLQEELRLNLWKHLDEIFPTPPFSFRLPPWFWIKMVSEISPRVCVTVLLLEYRERPTCQV